MYQNIIEKINNSKWKDALEAIHFFLDKGIFDEEIAILLSTVNLALGYIGETRKVIIRGLNINCCNYELWLLLGQYYETFNANQAFLCYENALYHCDKNEDQEIIKQYIGNIKNNKSFSVKKCLIVIDDTTGNEGDFEKCINQIQSTCFREIYHTIRLNTNKLNFDKEKILNSESDILFINNNILLAENALFWLRMGLYKDADVGATTGVITQIVACGLPLFEDISMFSSNEYEKKVYLGKSGILVKYDNFLKNLELIDSLIENRDNTLELSYTCLKTGMEMLLCRNSYMLNLDREDIQLGTGFNEYVCEKKWGFSPLEFMCPNADIIKLINLPSDSYFSLLDIGCGLGATLYALKNSFPNAEIYGIEERKTLLPYIANNADILSNTDNIGDFFEKDSFDFVLFEYQSDYGNVRLDLLRKIKSFVKKEGIIKCGNCVLKREDIPDNCSLEERPSIAFCILTHNHPEAVEDVLSQTNLIYMQLQQVDIYFYDSSENDRTKEILDTWIKQGYTNLYHVPSLGKQTMDKMFMAFQGEGTKKKYDYIWPLKDRIICPLKTLKCVLNNLYSNPDFIYLEVNWNEKRGKNKFLEDGIELYRNHSLGLTSLDTTIYRVNTVLLYEKLWKFASSNINMFPHFYFILTVINLLEHKLICILQNEEVYFSSSNRAKSGWQEIAFYVWKDCWIIANENLPDCYKPYTDEVIKHVASQPWLIGGRERLIELKKMGVLNEQKLDEIKINWERVSNIPFEDVCRIAKEE